MIWSFVLAAGGVLGIYLAGKKMKVGWLVGLLMQVLWIVYGVWTHQWGFIISAVAYGFVYAKNWWTWYTEEIAEDLQ